MRQQIEARLVQRGQADQQLAGLGTVAVMQADDQLRPSRLKHATLHPHGRSFDTGSQGIGRGGRQRRQVGLPLHRVESGPQALARGPQLGPEVGIDGVSRRGVATRLQRLLA